MRDFNGTSDSTRLKLWISNNSDENKEIKISVENQFNTFLDLNL